MDFINIEQAAEKWGISIRRVQDLCKQGRVPGAKRFGNSWMIPFDAVKPLDGRTKNVKTSNEKNSSDCLLLRKSPFLDMTDLYTVPGNADNIIASLSSSPKTQQLFKAEILYSRGALDEVYSHARDLLSSESDFYSMISGGMLLALVAMWEGDIKLWHDAKKYMYEAPWKNDKDREIIALSIASTDLSIRNTKDFPEWFTRGRFEMLPFDAQPAARVFYIKHLLFFAQELAIGQLQLKDVSGLGLMRVMPYIIEPLVSQSYNEKIVMEEIYLRLLCAIAYHQTGDDSNAAIHLDRAIELCLADKLYGPLVEHRRQLGLFLDERILLLDTEAARKVKELHKKLHEGWVVLHNAIMGNNIISRLSDREREVVRLAAFGLSDEQISDYLHITKSSVKSMMQMARNKTGIKDRADFGAYI